MSDINRVMFTGHLGGAPVLKTTSGGNVLCEFTVAVCDQVKQRDGTWAEETSYIKSLALWGERAEKFAKDASEGDFVVIDAALKEDKWRDRQSGEERSKLKIKVVNVTLPLAGTKQPSGQGGGAENVGQPPSQEAQDETSWF